MTNIISEDKVYDSIKKGLAAFRILSKEAHRNASWKQLTKSQRANAARAWIYMDKVAQKPELYFSRDATYEAWLKRATRLAELSHCDVKSAFYIVPDPKSVVWQESQSAFIDRAALGKEFYQFCSLIQDWEYGRVSSVAKKWEAEQLAKDIVEESEKYSEIANVFKSKPGLRNLKRFAYSLQKQK